MICTVVRHKTCLTSDAFISVIWWKASGMFSSDSRSALGMSAFSHHNHLQNGTRRHDSRSAGDMCRFMQVECSVLTVVRHKTCLASDAFISVIWWKASGMFSSDSRWELGMSEFSHHNHLQNDTRRHASRSAGDMCRFMQVECSVLTVVRHYTCLG